jgi:PAS domain S-box-containing protein
MSKQKNFNNRINDLFADLDQKAAAPLTDSDSISGWVWECDVAGRFTLCSPEGEALLGYAPQEFIGQSLKSFLVTEESSKDLGIIFAQEPQSNELDLYYQTISGKIILVRANIKPIFDAQNQFAGFQGLNQVITSPAEQEISDLTSQSPTDNPNGYSSKTISTDFQSLGVAIEVDHVISVTKPLTDIGRASVLKRESIAVSATAETPATLAVPVDLQEQSLGLFEIIDPDPNRKWNQDELRLVEQVADQLALALENARLFQETQVSLSRTEALYNVGQAAIAFENLEELLQAVIDSISAVLPANRTLIAVFDTEKEAVSHFFESNAPPIEIRENTYTDLMKGLTGWCVRERESVLSIKGQIDSRESEEIQKIRIETEAGSLVVVPLIYRDEIFGTITTINTPDQRDFNQGDLELLNAMSNQIATALANSQLFQEEQRRRRIADTLSETARVVGATLELEDVGNRLLAQLIDVVDFSTASLQSVEGDQRRLIAAYSKIGDEKLDASPLLLRPISEDPLVKSITDSRKPLIIPDTQNHPMWENVTEIEHVRSWLCTPLLAGEETIGLLFLNHSAPNAYDDETVDLVSAIAAQASVAIRNARLFEQIQRRSVQLQTAAEVSRAASSILEPNPLIQQTVNLIQDRFNLYYVGLFLIDQTGELTQEPGRWAVLRAGTGEAGRIQIERSHKLEVGGGSMIGECIRTAEPQTPEQVSDTTARFVNPLLPETQTEIALPLISRGQVIGAMTIQSTEADAFGSEDVSVLQTMADQVANALQNANLFNQTQARAGELQVLNEMSRTLSQNLDINSIVQNIYLYGSRLIDTTTLFIALYNPETNEISFPYSVEAGKEIQIPSRPLSAGLTEYVIRNREPVLIHENVLDWMKDHGIEMRLVGEISQSWLGVPLAIGVRALGIICVQNQAPHHFSEQDLELMIAIASQSAIAIQNSNLFAQTQAALSETEELVRRLALLNELSEELSRAESFTEAYSFIAMKSEQIFSADRVTLAMLTPEKDTIEVVALQGETGTTAVGDIVPLADSTLENVITKNQTVVTPDTHQESLGAVRSFIVAPVAFGTQIVGTLNIGSRQPNTYGARDENLIQQLVAVIGSNLENRQLFDQVQDALSETESLLSITNVASSSLELQSTLDEVLNLVLNTIQSEIGLITIANPYSGKLDLLVHRLPNEMLQGIQENGLEGSLCELVFLGKEPIYFDDLSKTTSFNVSGLLALGYNSYQGVPLEAKGEILGTLCTFSTQTISPDSNDITLLGAVGQQIGVTIENANLFEQTQEQAAELAILNEMSRELSTIFDLDEIMATIHKYTSQLMDTTYFFISLYNQREDTIAFPLVYEKGKLSAIPEMEKRRGLTQHVIDTKKPLLISENVEGIIKELGLEKIIIGDPAQSWLGVPLIIGAEVLGVIATQNADTPHVFNEHHQDLLVSIARQSAIAIQTARLFQATQKQTDDLAILNDMGRELTTILERDQVFETVFSYTSQLLDTTNFFIATVSDDQKEIFVEFNVFNGAHADSFSHPSGSGLTGYILETGEALLLEDDVLTHMEKLGVEYIPIGDRGAPLCWLGVPMLVGGQVVGVIAVQSVTIPRLYDTRQRDILASIAGQTAISLQNAELFNQTQLRSEEIAFINRIVTQISGSLDLSVSLEIVASELGKALNIQTGIALLNTARTTFTIIAAHSPNDDRPSAVGVELPVEGNLSSQKVIETMQTLIVDDAQNDPITAPIHSVMKEHGVVSLGLLPLISAGEVIGTVGLDILEPGRKFSEDEIRLAETIVAQAATAIENSRLFTQTQQQLDDLQIIQSTTSELSESLSFEDVSRTLINSVVQAAQADSVSLFMLQDNNMIRSGSHPAPQAGDSNMGEIIPLDDYPLTQQVIRTRKPSVLFADDPRLQERAQANFKAANISTNATIPMIGPDGVLGVISLNRQNPAIIFQEEEIRLVSTLANQAAIAIQNSRLFDQVQTALNEMAALYQASSELNTVQSYDEILTALRNHTILGENIQSVSINLFDYPWIGENTPEWLIPIARWNRSEEQTPSTLRYPISGWTTVDQLLTAHAPTTIEDPANDPRLDDTGRQFYLNQYDAKSLAFAPLVSGGSWYGHITAIYDKPMIFSENDVRQMMTLVGQAAVAIQNIRSLEDSVRKAGQLETAAEIARDTSATLSLEELLNRSVNAVRDRFDFYHTSIFLLDESGQNAAIQAATGEAGIQMIDTGHQLKVGSKSLIGSVTAKGEYLVVNDISQDETHEPHPLLPETLSELAIPLKIGNRVIGALDVQSQEIDTFQDDDIIVLQTLADQISVAIDNARAYQAVQEAIAETERRVQDLTTLSDASQSLSSAPLDTREVANVISQQISHLIPNESSCSIALRDSMDPDMMITVSTLSLKNGVQQLDDNPKDWDFRLSEYPATAKTIESQEYLVINISDENADPDEIAYMTENEVGTMVVLPLTVKGLTIGIIEIETWKNEYRFSAAEINLLTTLANQAAISLENARLYEEQFATAEQLRELDQLKSQFLANMSHELRTPLNSIIGFSRVIMKGIDGPVTDLQHQDLGAIYNAGQHLLKMINDILDISKIDAGKMELAFEDVIITDIIASVMSTARGLVKDKPVELISAIEEDLPIVNADSTRVRQILLNLLSNASKFTDEGSITLTTRQQTNADGHPELYLSVKDTGVGIAAKDQDKLFEPFVQVDGSPTRATGGTGLGLSITRLLVELHGGEISLISSEGKGSDFFFTLPLDDRAILPPDVAGGNTVLVIDDDMQVIQLYERYLSGSEFEIVPLTDPSKTMEFARQIQPFAITLDIMLPERDGWQLLEELQADPNTRHIPVIICSIVEDIDKGFDLGATDYLVKPILGDDFIASLNRIKEYQ